MNWKKLLKAIGIVLLIVIVFAIILVITVLARSYPWVFALYVGLCLICVAIQAIYDSL